MSGAEMYVISEDKKLEQQIDHEIRMRDGTAKLLAASRNPNQLLEAAKSLHTSNARMLAYMSELQRRKTNEVLQREDPSDGNQVPCKAKVSLSDLRIPLLWKEAEHFKNKGDHRRYAVFCLVKIGTDIYDTALLKNIDRTSTDLTFDDVITFDNIRPDFECQLEVYCHRCQDDLSVASTPKRIKKKIEDFGNSVGRSVGKRLSGLKYDSDNSTIIGPKFDCIASATLKLADIDDCVGIFNLTLETDSAFTDLPLFGNFCCRLVAQPYCLIENTISGQMYFQDPESLDWDLYTCCLCNLSISCWREKHNSGSPNIIIPVTKRTQVSEVPASLCKREHCIQIIGDGSRYNLAAPDVETKKKWWDAIYQHLLDQVMWLQACEHLMEIKSSTPRRSSAYSKGMFSSLYDSVDDPASPMTRVLNRLNIPECAEDEENQPENSKTKLFTEKTEQSTSSNQMETEVSSNNQTIDTDATVAATSDTSSTDEDSKHSGSEKEVVPSETCSAASATVAVCESSNKVEMIKEKQGQICANVVKTSTTENPEETARNTLPEGNNLQDQEEDCIAKDESVSQEVLSCDVEPENAECLEEPDEYSKENVAENSWFHMMRQNEDANMIMDEEGDAQEMIDEESSKIDDESHRPVDDSLRENLADLVVTGEYNMELSHDSIPGYATEESHRLDKTEDIGNENRQNSDEVESKADSTSDELCERAEMSGKPDGIEETENSVQNFAQDESSVSGRNINTVLDKENGINNEIKQSSSDAENDVKTEGDKEDFGQSLKMSSDHAEDEKGLACSGSDEDTVNDKAESSTKMDKVSVDDGEIRNNSGKTCQDNKTCEEKEEANCAEVALDGFKSKDEVENVVETGRANGNDENLKDNEKESKNQVDLLAENDAMQQPENVVEAESCRQDTDQSQCNAQSDSNSENNQQFLSQSVNGVEGHHNSGGEGHVEEGTDDDNGEDSDVPEEGNVKEKIKEGTSQSQNITENITENTEKSDANKDALNQPETSKETDGNLEVNDGNLSEKDAEKDRKSDDETNCMRQTEEQKSRVSKDDNDADNNGRNTKCGLNHSLSKETSV